MPSVGGWPDVLVPQLATAPNPTLDQAQPLTFAAIAPGLFGASAGPSTAAGAQGRITNSGGAGGVDWYSFTLTKANTITLATFDVAGGQHLDSVVTLYNTQAFDPFYPLGFNSPPYNPQQHRALAQLDAVTDAPANHIDRDLAPGTYYVAVSGHGNNYFQPFLAGSGYAGSIGDYRLLVTATALPLQSTNGPAVLAVEPLTSTNPRARPSLTLHSSPLAIGVDFSTALDPTTVTLAQPGMLPTDPLPTVQLLANPTGQFGDGNDTQVILAGAYFALDANELQLKLGAPLAPGSYQLILAGNPGPDQHAVLTDATDTWNLGQDASNPRGEDYSTVFRIDGSEGIPASGSVADDTPAMAHDLGSLAQGRRLQVTGAIGNDPAYDPTLSPPDPSNPTPPALPFLWNPAAQVNLYHFQINGPGLYDFGAEVFAGRIGSPLDPALSLFQVSAGQVQGLQLVASNDNSRNDTPSSDGRARPLFGDPVLQVSLGAGDYYLAVSASGNMPSRAAGNQPGQNGIFDPNVSHSGFNGTSTGDYVLNVLLQPPAPAPRVVATTPAEGTQLAAPPTQFTVTFDSSVNVAQLAEQAFNATAATVVSGVFLVGPAGQRFLPRLAAYDPTTHQATFALLERLPNGVNTLHLSGATGLTGPGGSPLLGNDATDPVGDYLVHFTVADPHSPGNDPLLRIEQERNESLANPQDLGILFPHEIQSGVTVAGTLQSVTAGTPADADYYAFQVLQDQEYHFKLTGPSPSGGVATRAPAGVRLTVTDATGTVVPQDNPRLLFADLPAGWYVLTISRASKQVAPAAAYQVQITLLDVLENPPPLSVGNAPALQIRLNNVPSPAITSATPGPVGGLSPVTMISLPASSNGRTSAPTGSAPTLVADLAPALRADLLGGVTSSATSSLIVASPSVQIQGLENGPVLWAGSSSTSTLTAITTLVFEPLSGSNRSELRAVARDADGWQWLFDLLIDATSSIPRPSGEGAANQRPAASLPAAGELLFDGLPQLWDRANRGAAYPLPPEAGPDAPAPNLVQDGWLFTSNVPEDPGRALVNPTDRPQDVIASGPAQPGWFWSSALAILGFLGQHSWPAALAGDCRRDKTMRRQHG